MVWVILALEGILLILFAVSHWRYHKNKIQFSIRFDGKKVGLERILTPLGMFMVVDILHVKFAKAYRKAAFEDIRQMAPGWGHEAAVSNFYRTEGGNGAWHPLSV